MNKKFKKVIDDVTKYIENILKDNLQSVYVYGSLPLNDFKLGWSDIDILVLTKNSLDKETSEKLLHFRQDLLKTNPKNKYYRSFEGAMLSLSAFLNKSNDTVVYLGTKGEKIKDNYILDSFSMKELIESSYLIYGEDVRSQFKQPTYNDLYEDVNCHYLSMLDCANNMGRNLYSFGWFLDISRCIYTLKTGEIISKTKAGEWALKNKLCPNHKALKISLKVRKNPLKYKKKKSVIDYAETLGKDVKKYLEVLERFLKDYKNRQGE